MAASEQAGVPGHRPGPASAPIDTGVVGRTFSPHAYVVARDRVQAYARAVGETDPLHLDLGAARGAGHPDLVAPPMFAAVYCAAAVHAALTDPALGIDLAMLLHGAQEFSWGELVHAGDEITTELELAEVYERVGLTFYRFRSRSVNQRGEDVCAGLWTHIVRPRT